MLIVLVLANSKLKKNHYNYSTPYHVCFNINQFCYTFELIKFKTDHFFGFSIKNCVTLKKLNKYDMANAFYSLLNFSL